MACVSTQFFIISEHELKSEDVIKKLTEDRKNAKLICDTMFRPKALPSMINPLNHTRVTVYIFKRQLFFNHKVGAWAPTPAWLRNNKVQTC